MSQSKVDKRKYEKKNRAAIMKREKRKKILGWCIFGVLVGCILAATLGVKIYKAIPKYVEAEKLGAYVSQTWQNRDMEVFSLQLHLMHPTETVRMLKILTVILLKTQLLKQILHLKRQLQQRLIPQKLLSNI